MDVWPQNGWFLGVRRALFTRAARKRTAVGVLLVVVFVLITERVSRPDPSRVEQEQYAVYSAYLFSVPVEAKPLPVVCAEDPKYAGEPGEGGFAEIHRYFVSDESISAFSQPSAFAQLMGRKIAAPFVPINVFNNFVVRNLSAAHFTKRFSGANSEKLALEHALPDMSDLQQQHCRRGLRKLDSIGTSLGRCSTQKCIAERQVAGNMSTSQKHTTVAGTGM